jgi:hypothetical protein
MTTSQSDVDKVMAMFDAAPLNYRSNEDKAAASNGSIAVSSPIAPSTKDRGAASAMPSARAADRIPAGAGGSVREIFPLLSRAVPVVGDLKVGPIERPDDARPVPGSVGDNVLPARLHGGEQRWSAPEAGSEAGSETGPLPPVVAEPAPMPAAALPAEPLPPLRTCEDLIRPVAQNTARPPRTPLPAAFRPAVPRPAVPRAPETPSLPPRAPPPANPVAAYPPPPQVYPPYYPPQAMPPAGMPLYPAHPGAAGWPQPGYPPPYAPPYPPGYPAAYHPYGYPQQPPPGAPQGYAPGYPPGGYPPGYGAPPPYPLHPPYPPQPMPMPMPGGVATAPPPASLSEIFAALHRAPAPDRGEETPQ